VISSRRHELMVGAFGDVGGHAGYVDPPRGVSSLIETVESSVAS